MLERLARVLCDTSFLIHLATRRISNIDSVCSEIGSVTFVVPEVVLGELGRLRGVPEKRDAAEAALRYAEKLETVPMAAGSADPALVEHARNNRSIIGTMDRALKKQVREAGGSVMSFWNDRIVLE